jgi:hypothetical protein
MPGSTARVATDRPLRYLEQICRHLGHKLRTEQVGSTGVIWHSAGTCSLAVDGSVLVLQATADTAENLAIVQDVVARHLMRFGARDGLVVTWTASA